MGFGFSKTFAVVFIFSAAYGYYLMDIRGFFTIMIPFIIIKIIWKMLTQK